VIAALAAAEPAHHQDREQHPEQPNRQDPWPSAPGTRGSGENGARWVPGPAGLPPAGRAQPSARRGLSRSLVLGAVGLRGVPGHPCPRRPGRLPRRRVELVVGELVEVSPGVAAARLDDRQGIGGPDQGLGLARRRLGRRRFRALTGVWAVARGRVVEGDDLLGQLKLMGGA
jgi:hypothetical protein